MKECTRCKEDAYPVAHVSVDMTGSIIPKGRVRIAGHMCDDCVKSLLKFLIMKGDDAHSPPTA